MERENAKRKSTMPPGDKGAASSSKMKKFDSQDASTSRKTVLASGEPSRGSVLTKKLVSMWMGGSNGQHPFMTQEVRESLALKDAQAKVSSMESLIKELEKKVALSETTINDINKVCSAQEKAKAEIVTKMNLMEDLVPKIMDHINYIMDTLQRCQAHKKHLTNLYNAVVVKQKEERLVLVQKEITLQNTIRDYEKKICNLQKSLEQAQTHQGDKMMKMQASFKQELAKARKDYEKVQKQLEEMEDEKKKTQNALVDKETCCRERGMKIIEYETALKNLKEKWSEASTNLESSAREKLRLEKELADKNQEIKNAVEELKSTRLKLNAETAEISTVKDRNNEMEEKIKCEIDQREALAKSLQEASERIEELSSQMEKLKEEKEKALREAKEMIEIVERESRESLAEARKEADELKSKQERLVKIQEEKYESCLVEMKILENSHRNELARARASSESLVEQAALEKRKLEEAVGSLTREKQELQLQMQQTVDLLKKQTDSASDLKEELERALADKKRDDEEKEEKDSKIRKLEMEIFNLQFEREAEPNNENKRPSESVDSVNKAKEKDSKKPVVSKSYKRPILKNDSKPRRTRSSSPSPITQSTQLAAEKKVTFNFRSSSEESPVKLAQSSSILELMDSAYLFDDLIGTGKSCSQPSQSSQTLNSQISIRAGNRKFFKSRSSQSK